MADYNTLASFVFIVPPEARHWGLRFYRTLREREDAWGDYILADEEPEDQVLYVLADNWPELEVNFHCDSSETGIWIGSTSSGTFDVDNALRFMQIILQHFNLNTVHSFEWANTCSNPAQLDTSSGGAVVLIKDRFKSLETYKWIEQTRKELADATR